MQTRSQVAPASNAQDAKNFRTPKITISLLGEQELQDSGHLKRVKAMAIKRSKRSQRRTPALREIQVTGTNSKIGMHQDFFQMVMPKFRLYTSSGDVPAEASVQSWPLCTRTQASKMIQERVLLEETKQKHRALGHLHPQGHLHP